MERMRSTSPPKSAWPGVSTMLMRSPSISPTFLARMVMPRSFSRSFESMTRSSTRSLSRNTPDCCKAVDEGRLAVVDVGNDGDVAKLHGRAGFSNGRRPNGAGRAALSIGREDNGNATARPALAVALARDNCAAQYTKRGREGRVIGFRRRARRAPASRAEARGSTKTFKVEATDGADRGCELEGRGSAVVLIHGNSSSSRVFRASSTGRWGRFGSVAVDLPGHGASDDAKD